MGKQESEADGDQGRQVLKITLQSDNCRVD